MLPTWRIWDAIWMHRCSSWPYSVMCSSLRKNLSVFLLCNAYGGAPVLNDFVYCHFFIIQNSGFGRHYFRIRPWDKVLKWAPHCVDGFQSLLPVKELCLRKLILLKDLIKMMDLLRNRVNLLEVLMGTERFCALHFHDSLFLWSNALCWLPWSGKFVLLCISRVRMRKSWTALLMHLVVWVEFPSLLFQSAVLYDFKQASEQHPCLAVSKLSPGPSVFADSQWSSSGLSGFIVYWNPKPANIYTPSQFNTDE